MKRNRSRWLGRIRATILGILLGVLILEAGLRAIGFAISLSDDSHRATNADANQRVLCLGACYTIGLGSSPEESYPAQLQDMLNAEESAHSVSVINGGVRGKSIDYFSDQIDHILDETEPNVLVLNVNDRIRYQSDILESLERSWLRSSLYRFRDFSVLARVIWLALEGPPRDTGMPDTWWSNSRSSDQLALRIEEAEANIEVDSASRRTLLDLASSLERRAEFEDAIRIYDHLIARDPQRAGNYLRRAEARIMTRYFQGAWQDLQWISGRAPEFRERHQEIMDEGRSDAAADSNWVHEHKRAAIFFATWGEPEQALRLVEEVVEGRPGTAWAHDYLDFFRAVTEARRSGAAVTDSLPSPADLYGRMSGARIETEASYGLFSEDEEPQESRASTPDEAADRFTLLLRYHLERIHHATEERDVVLIVENMSSRPEQQAILARICGDLGIPLVPLQSEFANHPNRDDFLHPTQSLRLSPAGNTFMAERIYTEVRAALDTLTD